jgi:hypothetical protein
MVLFEVEAGGRQGFSKETTTSPAIGILSEKKAGEAMRKRGFSNPLGTGQQPGMGQSPAVEGLEQDPFRILLA